MKQPNYFLSIAYNLVPVLLLIYLTNLKSTNNLIMKDFHKEDYIILRK